MSEEAQITRSRSGELMRVPQRCLQLGLGGQAHSLCLRLLDQVCFSCTWAWPRMSGSVQLIGSRIDTNTGAAWILRTEVKLDNRGELKALEVTLASESGSWEQTGEQSHEMLALQCSHRTLTRPGYVHRSVHRAAEQGRAGQAAHLAVGFANVHCHADHK